MSLKYIIKDFYKVGNKQHVGMFVTDEKDRQFVIDKEVDFQEGRTDEEYINDALVLMKPEIKEWQDSYKLVGREFDADNKKFKE
tara:strand:+ start:635 stop:886 length:252 start_codon:yes stop_codon:yes gene_type:complete